MQTNATCHLPLATCHALLACALLLAGPAFGADWPYLLATGGDQYYVTNGGVGGVKAYGVHIFTNTSGDCGTGLA